MEGKENEVFTFQYGQIYYATSGVISTQGQTFTFQYGQIYYTNISCVFNNTNAIYIPIWLDLLYA